jgi:hypothetical protein
MGPDPIPFLYLGQNEESYSIEDENGRDNVKDNNLQAHGVSSVNTNSARICNKKPAPKKIAANL